MSLTETLLRATWPALMATRQGRLLPGRLARRMGPERRAAFLASLKKVNGEQLQRAEARGDSSFRAYPGFITVAGTSRCNIRCEFCINQWDAKPDGSNRPHMKAEHVQAIVAEVFPYLRQLALSVSGEPLYDPHFQELLDAAREHGVFVEFTTNAMLVSKPGMLDRILQGVGRVNISMDGATKETFERLRGGAKFDKVCENVRMLTAGRAARGQRTPEYNIRYILMRDTIDELPAMVDLAKDLGVDHLYTNHLQVFMAELKDQSLVQHKARANRAFAEARARAAARNQVVVLPADFDLAIPDGHETMESAQAAEAAARSAATAAAIAASGSVPVDTGAPSGASHSPAAHPNAAHPAGVGTAGSVPVSVAQISGEAWAGTGTVERAAPRPAELPPTAYLGRCPYLWDQAFFEADGSIFPCCNSGGIALGHLDKSPDFWSIWTGEAYDAMRASVYSPQCHNICVNCYLREGTVANEAYVRPVEGVAATGGASRRKARR